MMHVNCVDAAEKYRYNRVCLFLIFFKHKWHAFVAFVSIIIFDNPTLHCFHHKAKTEHLVYLFLINDP